VLNVANIFVVIHISVLIKVCGPTVCTFNSTYTFGHWIKSGSAIAKIVISSFRIKVEMQNILRDQSEDYCFF
jgi:hypothetical protein